MFQDGGSHEMVFDLLYKNFINALKVKICVSINLCSCEPVVSVKNKCLPFQNEQPFHNKAVHLSSSVL